MEPISALSIINGSLSLVCKLSNVIAQIHSLRSIYNHAELSLQSLSSQCRALRLAVSCIKKDLQIRQHTAEASINDAVAAELQDNLETSGKVLDGLEEELESLKEMNAGVSRNVKVAWETDCLKEHENRVRGQIHCWTMLLQILDRPTMMGQEESLEQHLPAIREITDSVRSIIPSHSSTITALSRKSSAASGCEVPLEHCHFDFDDFLFTSGVYKRNFRTRRMATKSRGHTRSQSAPITRPNFSRPQPWRQTQIFHMPQVEEESTNASSDSVGSTLSLSPPGQESESPISLLNSPSSRSSLPGLLKPQSRLNGLGIWRLVGKASRTQPTPNWDKSTTIPSNEVTAEVAGAVFDAPELPPADEESIHYHWGTCFVELSIKTPAARLTIQTLLDPGINFSFISKDFAKAFDVPIVESPEKSFTTSVGRQHKVLGQTTLPVYPDKADKSNAIFLLFLIIANSADQSIMLGRDVWPHVGAWNTFAPSPQELTEYPRANLKSEFQGLELDFSKSSPAITGEAAVPNLNSTWPMSITA